MAEMFDIYETQGAQIGEIPISAQQRKQLHLGATVTIIYHTPRMILHLLGQRNGAFEVWECDGRLVSNDVEAVKHYIELQADIAKAMKPENWKDPDAESNSPVR